MPNYGTRNTSKIFLVTFRAIVSWMIDTKIGFLDTFGREEKLHADASFQEKMHKLLGNEPSTYIGERSFAYV